ncbi:MAG: hypothetical protein AAFZ38_10035 [Myxococcota bacterium]
MADLSGNTRSLDDHRRLGPVVVQFFRGSWCPFCNLQLATQDHRREMGKDKA